MHANRHSLKLFGLLGAVFFAAAPASAQCTDQWLPGEAVPGLDGGWPFQPSARSSMVYDDGTGPALYVGGVFTIAGEAIANNIVRWDGTSWSPLGSGMGGPSNSGQQPPVLALTAYNGELIAGGAFTSAGENVSAYWARWGSDVPLGDLDGDCTVGRTDLDVLLATWGPCADCRLPGDCPADLDGDCTVGVVDLLILLGNWG